DSHPNHLCRFAVRVLYTWSLAGFLGSKITCTICAAEALQYCRGSAESADLPTDNVPTPFNALFRQCAAVSRLRHRIAVYKSTGILTRCPSDIAIRLVLRPRLTLIRLALIRKPWSFGGRVSHPPYRYSCLHLLFHTVQDRSPCPFTPYGMLPYQYIPKDVIHSFGTVLDARLLSTPGRSTSELLRTL